MIGVYVDHDDSPWKILETKRETAGENGGDSRDESWISLLVLINFCRIFKKKAVLSAEIGKFCKFTKKKYDLGCEFP